MGILDFANPYHAYIFGTSFWYFLRGIVRVIDPATVVGWFRPPTQLAVPNDLELYTTRTDAYGLLTLSILLLVLADAVPLPAGMAGSTLTQSSLTSSSGRSVTADLSRKPYAKSIIAVTMFHHVFTGIGSYGHWRLPSHWTPAMSIGVWGNVGLFALGVVALVYLDRGKEIKESVEEGVEQITNAVSSETKVGGHSLRKRA